MTTFRLLAATCLAFAASLAQAHSYQVGTIDIGHPYARSTAAGQPTGGGYLSLTNKGDAPDRLLSASADVSERVELHSMKMEGTVMRMRQVEAIDIPAGERVALEPGGLHIMFINLKAPLKEGDRFPMTLRFEKAGEVKVDVAVEKPAAATAGHGHGHGAAKGHGHKH